MKAQSSFKVIPLTSAPPRSIVVDTDDYRAVNTLVWEYSDKLKCAVTSKAIHRNYTLQDFIMQGRVPQGARIKFLSGDRLDCRKSNLYTGEDRTNSAMNGGDFEADILRAGEEYRKTGQAKIIKIAVEKTGRGKHREKTDCDFIGWRRIAPQGVLIAKALQIEAKDIDKATLQILSAKEKGDGVKPHQLKALLEAQTAGADAFILWRTGGKVYRIDPRIAHERIGRSIHRDRDRVLMKEVPITKDGFLDFLYANSGEATWTLRGSTT